MICKSPDLTIDTALADPIIMAAMRADRIDPIRFEALLRSTACRLEQTQRMPALSVALMAGRLGQAVCEARRAC